MPWTADDFKKFSRDLSEAGAAYAARLANRILSSCLRRGGQQDECERLAIATALDRVKRRGNMGIVEATYTTRPWDGSFSRFTIEQLLRSVPRAIAAWAREQAKKEGRDVIKDDLRLPYKEPDGTININAVRNALARLSQVRGLPGDVLRAAREELQRVLEEYKKRAAVRRSEVLLDVPRPVVREENGTVRLGMRLARAGLWDFTDDYGRTYIALERPEEVFSEAFIAQWAGLPIILDHKPGEWISEENIEGRIVGVVLRAWRGEGTDSEYIMGEGVLWDSKAIEAINDGIVELSKGYECDVISEEGEWEGKTYNKIHSNMRLNHVAIVERGKCGGPCRFLVQCVKLCDEKCTYEDGAPRGQVNPVNERGSMEFAFAGKTFVVSEQDGARLFQEALNKHWEEYQALKAQVANMELAKPVEAEAEARERIAALEAEAKVYKTKCEEFEQRMKALESGEALQGLVTKRLNLVRRAEAKIPGYVAEGKSNRAIMVDVIKTFDGTFQDEGRPEAEVQAVYEAMLRAEENLMANAAKAVGRPVQDNALAARLQEARERIKGRSARNAK